MMPDAGCKAETGMFLKLNRVSGDLGVGADVPGFWGFFAAAGLPLRRWWVG